MIANNTKIYVIGKGFVNASHVSHGDLVYTLNSNLKVSIQPIAYISSDFCYDKINVIDAGQQNIDTTEDTRFLYYSDIDGSKYIKFDEIAKYTPNKEYSEKKYLPVLSSPYFSGYRKYSNQELEYIARMITIHDYDNSLLDIIKNCTGEDHQALVDLLEVWVSDDPGVGWFGRAQVKARLHEINDKEIAEAICLSAVLAGYTSTLHVNENNFWVMISYESRPVPGSRPKNEKYFKQNYVGNVYNLCAGENENILGMSKQRCFYLNTTSTLNNDIMITR